MQQPQNPAARSVAMTILYIFMATSAVGSISALQGNVRLSLYLCGAAVVVSVAVLLVGAWLVAASHAVDAADEPTNDDS
jgi:hypothetical protein